MDQTKRLYKGSDTDMLLSISTIVGSAISHQPFLVTKHPNWTLPYFNTLQTNINNVLKQYVGVDSASDLRKATRQVKSLQGAAFEQLADLRISIETGFLSNKPRRAELLKDLGYDKYNDAARKHNQESLINFLQQFAKAATTDVQAELIAEGASADTLAAVLAAAEPFTLAELAQEGYKTGRPETTAEAVTAYNNVFEEVMAVARNAARDFKHDPVVQKQFSYTHVLKQLNAPKKEEVPPAKEG